MTTNNNPPFSFKKYNLVFIPIAIAVIAMFVVIFAFNNASNYIRDQNLVTLGEETKNTINSNNSSNGKDANVDMEKLEKALEVVTQKMEEKDPDLPIFFAGIDPTVPELVIGIDEKAPLPLDVYKERLKELLGDIPMRVGKGQFEYDTPTVVIDGKIWNLNASLTNGTIERIDVYTNGTSIIISVNAVDDGEMTITLPRNLIDAKKNGKDIPFVVLADNLNVQFNEVASNQTERTLKIDIPAQTKKVEIIGTQIVPEFPVAIIIASIAIGVMIGVVRFKKIKYDIFLH